MLGDIRPGDITVTQWQGLFLWKSKEVCSKMATRNNTSSRFTLVAKWHRWVSFPLGTVVTLKSDHPLPFPAVQSKWRDAKLALRTSGLSSCWKCTVLCCLCWKLNWLLVVYSAAQKNALFTFFHAAPWEPTLCNTRRGGGDGPALYVWNAKQWRFVDNCHNCISMWKVLHNDYYQADNQ